MGRVSKQRLIVVVFAIATTGRINSLVKVQVNYYILLIIQCPGVQLNTFIIRSKEQKFYFYTTNSFERDYNVAHKSLLRSRGQ